MSSAKASQQQHQQQTDQQAIVNTDNKKKWYLLLSNPSKTTHLGTLLRCAAAFQVHQVLLVGYDKFNCQGSFGSHLFLDIVVFPSWDSVHEYLRLGGDDGGDEANCDDHQCDANGKQNVDGVEQQHSITNEIHSNKERGNGKRNMTSSPSAKNPISVIGILGAYEGGEEIFSLDGMKVYEDLDKKYASLGLSKDMANAINTHHKQDSAQCLSHCSFPINSRSFSSDVCFILSKDKRGLPLSQARMCTGFVHVPHLSFDDDAQLSQNPKSKDSMSATPKKSSSRPTRIPSIRQSNLLDTATTLSTVLHHFTAWARYTERSFEENQKFVKDTKPNERRRLCRRACESNEKRSKHEDTGEPDSSTEQDAMDSMALWNEKGDALNGSDY